MIFIAVHKRTSSDNKLDNRKRSVMTEAKAKKQRSQSKGSNSPHPTPSVALMALMPHGALGTCEAKWKWFPWWWKGLSRTPASWRWSSIGYQCTYLQRALASWETLESRLSWIGLWSALWTQFILFKAPLQERSSASSTTFFLQTVLCICCG